LLSNYHMCILCLNCLLHIFLSLSWRFSARASKTLQEVSAQTSLSAARKARLIILVKSNLELAQFVTATKNFCSYILD
jgi:hypothetical protein